MLTRQLTSSPSSLSALTSSNKRSFFPTRDILMDVSFFSTCSSCLFRKVDTIIRRLQPLERAKRWNAAGYWNAAGLFCIVCWQEILSPSYSPLERPKGYWNAAGFWNARRLLERAKRHTLTLKCVNFVNFVNFL